MDETILSIAQIKARYDAQWVLVCDPTTDDALEVQSGKVLASSKDRDEVYREATKLRPAKFAILYTGELPQDAAIVL